VIPAYIGSFNRKALGILMPISLLAAEVIECGGVNHSIEPSSGLLRF